jgi:hypothetical protein
VPLLRRPIVFGCVRGTARPHDLGICLGLQARPGSCVGGCSSAQGGGETDSLPQLVNTSCEVRNRQCWDILCLVQWVSVRHGVGLSGARDCLGTGNRGRLSTRAMGGNHSYPVNDLLGAAWRHASGGVRAGLVRWRYAYAEGVESPVSWGTGRIRMMIVQERAQMAGETMRMVGRVLVSLGSCFR